MKQENQYIQIALNSNISSNEEDIIILIDFLYQLAFTAVTKYLDERSN